MTKRKTAEDRAREIAAKWHNVFDHLPGGERTVGILKTHIVQDIQEAIEAHAKAEVRHATKNWGHGL